MSLLLCAAPAAAQVQSMPPSVPIPASPPTIVAEPSATVVFGTPAATVNPPATTYPFEGGTYTFDPGPTPSSDWSFQVVPSGLMYRSYLAGVKESRLGVQLYHVKGVGWMWENTLGARVGVFRYGTDDEFWPEGWQFDLEGAAFPRLDLDGNRDVLSTDFRAGGAITFRSGRWEGKIAYVHNCSHLGDEYYERFPGATRINYIRDVAVTGLAFRPIRDVRLYTEAGWAFNTDGGAKEWEFQFGAEYSPAAPSGARGAPFLAVNGHLREEVDFGGAFTAQTGWQWRGTTGRLMRLGAHYLNGKIEQYQFLHEHEEQLGMGLWYDF